MKTQSMSTGVQAKHSTQRDFAGTTLCTNAGFQHGFSSRELCIVGTMAILSILFLHDPTPNGHLHSANVMRVMNETGPEEQQTNIDLDVVLAAKSAFMHAHITAWHSDRMCDIIRRGLGQLSRNVTGPAYVNLNKPYPRKCLSPNAFTGVHTSEELRNDVFTNWTNWFESSPPRRITFDCCAQFITTRASSRGRSHTFWTSALRFMASPDYKIPAENIYGPL